LNRIAALCLERFAAAGVTMPLELPADERPSWQQLWTDVAELLKKPEMKPCSVSATILFGRYCHADS
jgi:hypothetical protein